jgi:hypothetical protein
MTFCSPLVVQLAPLKVLSGIALNHAAALRCQDAGRAPPAALPATPYWRAVGNCRALRSVNLFRARFESTRALKGIREVGGNMYEAVQEFARPGRENPALRERAARYGRATGAPGVVASHRPARPPDSRSPFVEFT